MSLKNKIWIKNLNLKNERSWYKYKQNKGEWLHKIQGKPSKTIKIMDKLKNMVSKMSGKKEV